MVPVVFPDSGTLWVFALTAMALLVVPGPVVLYVVVQGAEQGRRVALASVAGVHLGTLVHVAAATIGLSALIVASSLAFNVVKYAGAAYLIFIGIRKLFARDERE
jgi:threonine/homoserine/homoserine lactone efflux protein